MAPQLESEDEISEIEEVTETFLIASSLNSPLAARKEATNVDVKCENINFNKEISLEKYESETKHTSTTNERNAIKHSASLMEEDLVDDKSLENIGDVKIKNNNNGDLTIRSALNAPLQFDYKSTEDQENIRPCKLKAKNKLNLKLNFPLHSEEKAENGTTNRFTATLNLPSPVKYVETAEKNNAKGKRDNKMRVRISTKRGKVSLDNNNKHSTQETSNKIVHKSLGGANSQNDHKSLGICNSGDKADDPTNLCNARTNNSSNLGDNVKIINEITGDSVSKISLSSREDNDTLICDNNFPNVSTNDNSVTDGKSSGM